MKSIILGDLPRLNEIESLLKQRKAIKRQNKEVAAADSVNNAGSLRNRFLECLVPPKHIGKISGNETKLKITPDTIYQGHALEVLKTFPSETVDCVVTSPPYYGLRCYGTAPVIWNGDDTCDHQWTRETLTGQKTAPTKYQAAEDAFKPTTSAFCSKCGAFRGELGGEPTPELFISHLCDIFDEVKRVLKPTGTCFVNLADSYDKSHSLVGIPEMFVLEMKKRGWTYRNCVVWQKVNCFPESVKNRFTRDFENVFFFTKKGTGYYFEQQLEPCSPSTLKENRAPGVDRQRSYNSKYNRGDFRPSSAGKRTESQPKIEKTSVPDNQKKHSDYRNKRCVWSIPTANFKGEHFATFPVALVETPLKAGCPERGIVLDPFAGAGTTCLVAVKNGRHYIGIELNPKFREMALERINKVKCGRAQLKHSQLPADRTMKIAA